MAPVLHRDAHKVREWEIGYVCIFQNLSEKIIGEPDFDGLLAVIFPDDVRIAAKRAAIAVLTGLERHQTALAEPPDHLGSDQMKRYIGANIAIQLGDSLLFFQSEIGKAGDGQPQSFADLFGAQPEIIEFSHTITT